MRKIIDQQRDVREKNEQQPKIDINFFHESIDDARAVSHKIDHDLSHSTTFFLVSSRNARQGEQWTSVDEEKIHTHDAHLWNIS